MLRSSALHPVNSAQSKAIVCVITESIRCKASIVILIDYVWHHSRGCLMYSHSITLCQNEITFCKLSPIPLVGWCSDLCSSSRLHPQSSPCKKLPGCAPRAGP